MKSLPSVAFTAVVVASLAFPPTSSAQAATDIGRCRDTIAKQGGRFFKKKERLLQKCEDRVLRGKLSPPCPHTNSAARIARAAAKKDAAISKACTGLDPVSLGWADVCPSPCATVGTTTIGGLIECVDCVIGSTADLTVDLYYGASQAEGDITAQRCKRAIGKEAVKYIDTVVKERNKCEMRARKGTSTVPCPDTSTTGRIKRAMWNQHDKILAACTDLDPQNDLDFGTACAEVEGNCGNVAFDDLLGLVACIDCVSNNGASLVITAITGTATTTTTISTTTTTTLPAADPALVCQRAIEEGGMLYAEQVLQAIEGCAAPGEPSSIQDCLASLPVKQQLDAERGRWGTSVTAACGTTDVHAALGYLPACGATPSTCTFSAGVLDSPGESNDLLDCLACHIAEDLGRTGQSLFANQSSTGDCHNAIGQGGIDVMRTLLQQLHDCLTQPGATSIASCFQPDEAAWRAQAESSCSGIDPFTIIGYPNLCTGIEPVTPATCATHAVPCTFQSTSSLSSLYADNDLLDCLTCQVEEGVLGVARQLHGANLCCAGGICNRVLSRYSCHQSGGTPVYYTVDSLSLTGSISHPHGAEVGPDGWLYLADTGSDTIKKVSPQGVVSVVGNTEFFPTRVALDGAGNIYFSVRCYHKVFRMSPSGRVRVIAGSGTPGHSGDGGRATAAQITAPDGITLDESGNVYFTESGYLSAYACPGKAVGSERVRVVDSSGKIHTVVGSTPGVAGEGGPALAAHLLVPYSLRHAVDGTLLIGENFAMRVLRVEEDGTLTHVAGRVQGFIGAHSGYGGPALKARFYHTCGLASDPDGNVIVGAMANNRVALVDRLGSVIGIAGTGERSVSGSANGDAGPGALAQGLCCEDISVGADGTIYCADLWTNSIRVLHRQPF